MTRRLLDQTADYRIYEALGVDGAVAGFDVEPTSPHSRQTLSSNRADQPVVFVEAHNPDETNTLHLAAPSVGTRAGVTFSDRPGNEPGRARMLSISCHGPEDTYSDGGGTVPGDHHHVTFYSDRPGVENNKVLEWHWGPGWDGVMRLFMSLLITGGFIEAMSAADSDKSFRVRRSGEANERWSVRGNGVHWFGAGGSSSPDVNLQRAGPARLSTNGDLEFIDAAKGAILRSPDGSRWRVTVNDAGVLVASKL